MYWPRAALPFVSFLTYFVFLSLNIIVAALAAASDPFLHCWFWTAHFETQHLKTSWACVMGKKNKKQKLIWLLSIQPPFDPQIDSWPNLVLNLKEKRNHEDLHALTSFLTVENNLRSGGGSWVTKGKQLSYLFLFFFPEICLFSCFHNHSVDLARYPLYKISWIYRIYWSLLKSIVQSANM